MKWWLPPIALLLTPLHSQAVEFQTVTGTTLSSTLLDCLSPEEERFVNTVALHFINAKECWGQKVLPKQKNIDKVAIGTILACRRFWPRQPEKLVQFFSLVISESGGNNAGNPADPSYGVCHATLTSAHHACVVWGIPHPRSSTMCDSRCSGLAYKSATSFMNTLSADISFNLMCGAGEAAVCDIRANHDWVRAVLIYKFGEAGFINALMRLGKDKPITEIKSKNGAYIWKNYNRVYQWMLCLSERANILPLTRCGCMPAGMETPTK